MRNIEDLAAEEDSFVWEARRRGFRTFLLWAGIGFGIWGWTLFSQEQMGKGALIILASLAFFGVAWGILRAFSGSFLSFVVGLTAGLAGFILYSYSRLPSFYWGHDPSFWLSVHAGAVTEPLWSPLSYLLDEGAGFFLPWLQFSFLPELSAGLLAIALFFTLQVYFQELKNKTLRNVFFAFLICLALEVSAPFWNAGTMGSGLPSALGLLIFLFQTLLLKKEERSWRGLYFLLGLLWSVHPLWGFLGLLNHWGSVDFEGKDLKRNGFPFLLGLTPYLWVVFRAGKFFPSWGERHPFLEMIGKWKMLWLSHISDDWTPLLALKALGWVAFALGLLTILGFILNAFAWKSGGKIHFSVAGFWIWVAAGAGGWLFYSSSSELLGPSILWFLLELGGMLLKLLEKGSEKRNAAFLGGNPLAWVGMGGLLAAISLIWVPGQSCWRSQFYFPQQHALNLLQTLGEKSLLVCRDPFEAAACLETRLMEPTTLNSFILDQKYLNQKWYVTQVMAREPGIIFSNITGLPEDVFLRLIQDNRDVWDIQWDLSVLPGGWKGPACFPTVLTQEFANASDSAIDPERVQYRYDLAAMPAEGPTLDEITRIYYARYVTGFDELGKYLMGLGRYSDSIHAFDRALKLDPSFQEPQTYLAQMYSQKNILEAAQLEFEKIIHVQPEKIAELMRNIEDAQKEKSDSKTVSLLDQMIQMNSELANAQYQLSKIYDKEGRSLESKMLLEASIKNNPQQLEAQLTLGHLMKQMGSRIKAQEAFHAAMVVDPQNKEAQIEYWKLLNNR
jgi:tetratricopeptide (TPR) repeat protein